MYRCDKSMNEIKLNVLRVHVFVDVRHQDNQDILCSQANFCNVVVKLELGFAWKVEDERVYQLPFHVFYSENNQEI